MVIFRLPSVFPVLHSLETLEYSQVEVLVKKATAQHPDKIKFISLWKTDYAIYRHKLQMIEARKKMDDFLAEQMVIYQVRTMICK